MENLTPNDIWPVDPLVVPSIHSPHSLSPSLFLPMYINMCVYVWVLYYFNEDHSNVEDTTYLHKINDQIVEGMQFWKIMIY